ncbi:UDP-N-acetylmuramoyl-tripeptide--D-alanyl-D-alanine ligase [Deinococcus yavapaiensis]|uniref:UDP-N-acetylmuramoyl-tripeptide--D-alanyl-D-alanine ligase n=1 Tax=Deinococcus yavapaiensis KR-236 TaxID=694435 RepID=A0A318SBU9_9DEIO|nr:UDP-N-acetylmuramoyl-tripeptide--D-alanyl-D-alanine ligase [Deinococcus yavapaiensis]PYE56281.1 UDP-N-acetylmuramoyl-tripeptide--D-alanyl-D-alanine ligase [Deinococcus yavapaiensis KR-236]
MIDPNIFSTAHPDARPAQRITWDSRLVDEATAFAALAGERMHGNAFISQALDRGAPFILSNLDVERGVKVDDATTALRQWARATRDRLGVPVVGVTGSVGKTTAKTFAAAGLGGVTTPGNLNTLNAIACFLLEHGESREPLVMEMGIDRVGEMRELVDLVAPSVGVVTVIGESHLEAFGSRAVIAREKGVILEAPGKLVGEAAAAEWYPGVPSYGFGQAASFRGEALQVSPSGATFSFRGVDVQVPNGRRPEAEAALLGMILAEMHQLDLSAAATRIGRANVPGGRNRVLPGAFTIIDDAYNAAPTSMRAALDALAVREGRRIAVLGDALELGPTAPKLHREVGEYARSKAHLTFGVGEFGALLAERSFDSREALIEALLAEVRAGDVVLVKASRGVGLDVVVEALKERQRALA